jgi:acyl-coenzyme A thioesterase PaaI-like protein
MTLRPQNPPEARPLFVGVEPPSQLLDLADEVRRVIDAMVRVDEASPALEAIRIGMGELATRLEALARTGELPRMLPEVPPGPADLRPYYPSDARRWHVNPMHPRLELRFEDGVLTGHTELGLAWEGPPGHVHGGFVAMLLDQLLGHANQLHATPGVTGELCIRYRAPTPLHEPIAFRVERPERRSERTIVTRGALLAGGKPTAEAEGTFVMPRLEGTTMKLGPLSFDPEGGER